MINKTPLPYLIVFLCLINPLAALAQHAHDHAEHSLEDEQTEHQETAHDSDTHESQGDKNDPHTDDDHSDESSIALTPDIAQEVGIRTRIASPGNIERHINVYGRLVTPPDRIALTRARFPGLIKSIRVDVGDAVERNQVLAVIESNESLSLYEVRAPIDAVVQARNGSIGELTGDAPLFSLVDNSELWAELKIFPSQRFEVSPGQDIHVNHTGHIHEGTIASVTSATQGQPFVLARSKLTNTNGDMAPGDMVSAQIDAEKVSVSLMVETAALHTVEDKLVVFVQEHEKFTAREVVVGRSDGRFSEITDGLSPGEHYVVENSYVLKADLLKSGAAHEH